MAQGFFDPDALGDVAENNGDFWAFRAADTGCVDVEPPALQRLVLCYKTNRFARARDLAADLQPTHFNARQDFSQAFARNVPRSGLCGKGRIDLQKTAIDRLMLFIEDDFYDAKAFVHGVEQIAIALLIFMRCRFSQFSFRTFVMHDDDPDRPRILKTGDAHDKPMLTGRRVTFVFDLKTRSPPGDHVLDSREISRLLASLQQCLLTMLQAVLNIVDADADVGTRGLVLKGKTAPGLIDFQNRSGFIQHGNMTRQGIER